MKEIALQAGVGLATVDRVLNRRGGVRPQTTQRIRQAVDELARQSLQASLRGRRFIIDVVIDAPGRFSSAVREALEAELPSLRPAAFRVRFHLTETAAPAEIIAILRRIGRRGSHGVILKAPDLPDIAGVVAELSALRIPTVTLVTDIPAAPRTSYVGMDNRAAGETAAYLVAAWMRDARARVLVTLSSHRFLGEEQREAGFRAALERHAPGIGIVAIAEGRGMDRATGLLVRAALAEAPDIEAVYSIGGGNDAVLDAFRAEARACRVFIGHDLDADNRRLLRAGRIHAVLHHDLHGDMRCACRAILQAQRALPRTAALPLSSVAIVTPFNLPAHAAPE